MTPNERVPCRFVKYSYVDANWYAKYAMPSFRGDMVFSARAREKQNNNQKPGGVRACVNSSGSAVRTTWCKMGYYCRRRERVVRDSAGRAIQRAPPRCTIDRRDGCGGRRRGGGGGGPKGSGKRFSPTTTGGDDRRRRPPLLLPRYTPLPRQLYTAAGVCRALCIRRKALVACSPSSRFVVVVVD